MDCSSRVIGDRQPENVLLITVDTARADRYSYAGSSLVDTAVADTLAGDGTAFLAAYAPSPITLVSHASLMTGQEPFTHGVRNNGEFALASRAVTLAEILEKDGWETGAFVAAAVLDARYGLDQGFAEYDDDVEAAGSAAMFGYVRRRGERVVDAALRWLESTEARRTFLWVHLYDPHAPYLPPEPERSRYRERPYDGTIAYADRVVGTLLDGYRTAGRIESTLIVLTSDHGESLGAHGESTHGIFLYEETVGIPLVMSGAGVPAGVRVMTPVRLVDVMPTILDLLGLEQPPGIDGRSLVTLMSGEQESESRPIYMESLLPKLNYGWSPLQALRNERWKLIEGAGIELYDLESDAAEDINLADRMPDISNRLSEELRATVGAGGATTFERLAVDDETRRQLAVLGYLSQPTVAVDDRELPDPRTQIGILERMNSALNRFARGEAEGAIADFEGILQDHPDNLAASYNLGQLKFRVADYEGAAEVYGRVADLAGGDPKYSEFQGLALERAGKFEEALLAFNRALAVDPNRRGSRALRWRTLARLGRDRELVADLERALQDDPGDGIARVQLLRLRHGGRSVSELTTALEEAYRDYPDEPAIASALAHTVLTSGDQARAEDLYRKVLTVVPGDHDSSLVLGRMALDRGDVDEGRRILEGGVRKHPDRPAMQVAVARARLAARDLDGARYALARAQSLDSESADLWLVYAELHIVEGERERAVSDLERVAGLGDLREDRLDRLAEAYRALGLEVTTAAVAGEGGPTPR